MSPSRPLPPPGGEKLLLGVVHLPPLPGAPRYEGGGLDPVVEHARADAEALLRAGFHGFIVENFGDAPFFAGAVPPVVVASMTAVLQQLPVEGAVVGVNVLRNDAASALAVATAVGAAFIRVNVHVGAMVTDQGVVEGRAAETLRLRAALGAEVGILADVDVKHARPLGGPTDLLEATRETVGRGLADGVIVTGRATGAPVDPGDLRRVRDAAADRIAEECAMLEEARNGVLSELGRLGTLRDQLVPWAGLEIPREELRTLRTTATILGTVPSERAHALEVELEEVSDAVHLERVGEHEGTSHVVLFHRNEDTGRIADALRAAECSEASLPSFQGTVREELERIRAEISAKERERAEVEARSAELVPHRRELLVLIDHLSDCVAEEVIRSRFARTSRSMLIEGWMEGENFAQAKAELEAEFETVRVMEAESMPGEEPPTEFANAPAIQWTCLRGR